MRYFEFVATIKEDTNTRTVREGLWAKNKDNALHLAYRRNPKAVRVTVSEA